MNALLYKKNTWQLYDAKNQLSRIIEMTATSPQTITVRGKEAVVVLSCDDYRKLAAPKKNIADFLRGSLDDDDLPALKRGKSTTERRTPIELPA
jgi:prevent-host-death family protein